MLHAASSTIESANYSFFYLPKGTYDWLAGYPQLHDPRQSSIFSDGDLAESTAQVNQRTAPSGSAFVGLNWSKIKRLVVTQGSVFVRVLSSATGSVSTDAIRLVFVSSATSTNSVAAAPSVQTPAASSSSATASTSQPVVSASASNASALAIPIAVFTPVALPVAKTAKTSSAETKANVKSSTNSLAATIDTALVELLDLTINIA